MPEILLIITLLLILIIYMYLENKFLKVTDYTVTSFKIPKEFDGAKIVLLSDLHNNSFGKENKRLIEAIEKEKPDYIIIAGDMLVGAVGADYATALNLLKQLAKKYPIYYGTGNHEQRLSFFPETKDTSYLSYTKELNELGVHLLVNEEEMIRRGNASLKIFGLEIDHVFYKKMRRPEMLSDYIENEVGSSNPQIYNILIAHNPMYYKQYTNWGADLVLSGHLHGGIVRLPFLGGVISPQYILFPKYDAGKFVESDKTMIVSRGLGTHTIKLRLFNKPEVVVVKLKREDKIDTLQ